MNRKQRRKWLARKEFKQYSSKEKMSANSIIKKVSTLTSGQRSQPEKLNNGLTVEKMTSILNNKYLRK